MPKKFRATFEGEIPSYYIHGGDTLIEISKTSISISFTKNEINVEVGNKKYAGSYESLKKKGIFYITTQMENLHVNEFIELNKKSKLLLRKGVSPQPNALLKMRRD